jgi:ABC-type lipoprotein export system ATPase subunit
MEPSPHYTRPLTNRLLREHTNNGGTVIAASHDPSLAKASDQVITLNG